MCFPPPLYLCILGARASNKSGPPHALPCRPRAPGRRASRECPTTPPIRNRAGSRGTTLPVRAVVAARCTRRMCRVGAFSLSSVHPSRLSASYSIARLDTAPRRLPLIRACALETREWRSCCEEPGENVLPTASHTPSLIRRCGVDTADCRALD
ncbi:hypothetical protein B0H19DRAFT_1097494 [Mycena capillaripes]|nr:hypothetical protein B0H19DRAFT_1097494 [Mycena capillaripes]